jgi:hypothetical protein
VEEAQLFQPSYRHAESKYKSLQIPVSWYEERPLAIWADNGHKAMILFSVHQLSLKK